MSIFKHKFRLALAVALIAGIASFGLGYNLLHRQDAQVTFYNQGLEAYRSGDSETAIELFDRSVSVYKSRSGRSTWLDSFVYPAANREYAALAHFHKAKSLLRLRQAEPAVEAFKESLRLNPGNNYENLSGFGTLSRQDIDRLYEQALVVKYDLELLFNNNQDLADGQGKDGEPKDGEGEGEPKKQVPGKQPGQQPGKGSPNDI